ncbi:MAG: hypothetical protein K8M05_38750, partial [Deltaproteobacteria bacterium]|nr:hypothetical protein [Kofleriaceae bacterium]
FTDVTVADSGELACGITKAGGVACWGPDAGDVPAFDEGPYRQVSAALGYACAVSRDGRLACRGRRDEVVGHVPEGAFRAVAASTYHACAVELGGAYLCWGDESGRPHRRVVGNATSIATSATHGAALLGSGEIATWEIDTYVERLVLPPGPYVEVVAGHRYACGRRKDGALACTGRNDSGAVRPPAGAFERIAGGEMHACGVTAGGELVCWGRGYLGPVPETARAIALDHEAACWLDATGAIGCAGASHPDGPVPPRGTFRALSLDDTTGCAIDTAGDVRCWGFRAPVFEPTHDHVAIDVGLTGACALTRDGQASCPAHEDEYTKAPIPPVLPGTWASVSMGTSFVCGVTTTGAVRCFGDGNRPDERAGVDGTPAGRFASVVAGYEHACALAADGAVACWGRDVAGETEPPAGLRATRLALGEKKSCALDPSGAIVCWGRRDGGTLPSGPFVDLTMSVTGEDDEPAAVCGLTAASELRCGFF